MGHQRQWDVDGYNRLFRDGDGWLDGWVYGTRNLIDDSDGRSLYSRLRDLGQYRQSRLHGQWACGGLCWIHKQQLHGDRWNDLRVVDRRQWYLECYDRLFGEGDGRLDRWVHDYSDVDDYQFNR